jgi:hypothetical protein
MSDEKTDASEGNMIDLSGLASLFFEVSKEWREPNVVRIDGVDQEPVCQKLKADGCKLRWSREAKVRERARDGWKPVTERDRIGRPTIFLDRKGQSLLMFKVDTEQRQC